MKLARFGIPAAKSPPLLTPKVDCVISRNISPISQLTRSQISSAQRAAAGLMLFRQLLPLRSDAENLRHSIQPRARVIPRMAESPFVRSVPRPQRRIG
jgi:hypothetical protein